MAFIVKTNVKKTDDPKKKMGAVREGSRSVVIRNKKGETEAVRKEGDLYVNTNTMKEDRKIASGKGTGQYTGSGAAPRTGGDVKMKSDGDVKGGTKKMLKASKMRVRSNNASPQAKKSALKLYKKR